MRVSSYQLKYLGKYLTYCVIISCAKEANYKRQNSILIIGPRQANLVLIAYASSEGSGEPAHPRSLARTSAARSYKQCQEEPSDRKPDPWPL